MSFNSKRYKENAHFKCQKCNYTTNFQRRFDTHLFDEHLETSCSSCGKSFTHFNEYYSHLLSHVEPINCDGCNKQFLDKERYEYHIKMGHRDEPGNGFCPTCGIYCRKVTVHSLNFHSRININGEQRQQYPCPDCDYVPRNQNMLTRHIENVHKGMKISCI